MIELRELKFYSQRLYINFLKQHIRASRLLPSQEEEDHVKAFCVLSHAAIEEFIEKISVKTLDSAFKKFKSKSFIHAIPNNQQDLDQVNASVKQLINTLVLSCAYSIFQNSKSDTLKNYSSKLTLAEDIHKTGNVLTSQNVSELTKKTDVYTKDVIKEAIKFFDGHVLANHGASIKYLLKLLIPVGIDIPEEISLLNSLQKLAEYRGAYAHTQGNLTVILSASDAIKYMIDSVKLCNIIANQTSIFHTYAAVLPAGISASNSASMR